MPFLNKNGIKVAYGWQSDFDPAATPTFQPKPRKANSVLKRRHEPDFERDDGERQILRQRIKHLMKKRKSRVSDKLQNV